MVVAYTLEPDLSAQEFHDILVSSELAKRRPANDFARLEQMLRHADIIVTARISNRLVGVSRAITDFSFCCYLSDLAVDVGYQRQGIGKRLIEQTHARAGELTKLILIAAPEAESYYANIGMKNSPSCWTINRSR
jgi:ribosomal protein S18 acetylase RimI-like enzyme